VNDDDWTHQLQKRPDKSGSQKAQTSVDSGKNKKRKG